ncbi:MAG: gliding motility-associated C-terminal domain-containing protein [Bacteroidetes bacterium]|nr:gliding motility-associated C-terminal domain-containing protein [Bacteroidota bacterium]
MRSRLFVLFILSMFPVFGQDEIWIRPNRGQWHQNVEYQISIPSGRLFLENGGFTYAFTNFQDQASHKHIEGEPDHADEPVRSHVVRTHFMGANPAPGFEELKQAPFYENYFLGNDSTKWVTNNYACNEVRYLSLYNQIDLHLYESNATLKYDVVVHPGGNPSDFLVSYDGQDKLYLLNDALHIETTLGTIVEGKPMAYQVIDGKEVEVPCFYELNGNQMKFVLPQGYNAAFDLVIDPNLSFSTFTGSTADNWGMTACPDINKNLIAAGIVFGSGYPLSTGPFDGSFNGGQIDIGITKFNSTGSGIIFSTYLGGADAESPHSLIVNDANELYIFGVTSSSNFPLGTGAYQATKNGGSLFLFDNYVNFNGGSDLFITKLSPGGTSLLGSTYLGGSGNDGVSTGANIAFNYGDIFRGEVMVDDNSFVYVTTSTASSDFPIAGGGFDNSLGGSQDAIVAKLSSNLTSLLWSTYIGGTGLESGNSVQLSSTGDVFVGGGTTSSNFPATSGHMNAAFQGGSTDGYIIKFNAPGYGTPVATYLGTGDYDQTYFIQLDVDDYVYAYGQTKGAYTVTSGHYVNANSGQFIHKLNNNLVTTVWSSVFGRGSGNEEISPTAFLVSDCYEIYVAGWGGNTNTANSAAVNSTTTGFPVTTDAYQSTTTGSNFYLAQFTKDMLSLKYATFIGTGNGDHVDGGTSRFDKGGGVYHAVCAACGGNPNGFPTTSGVYSPTNNSSNCNLAAFLFELSKIEAALGLGSPVICIPDPVIFDNASQNGNTYYWDFGDGQTSTDYEPTHFYTTPGTYTAMLIVSDSSGCYLADTAYVDVEIQLLQAEAGTMQDTICPGESVQLFALGGDTYVWGPGEFLDDSTSANPIATIWEETTFIVTVESGCGSSTVEVTVHVFGAAANASPDTAICAGGSAQLFAGGGETYNWSPGTSLDNPNSASPIATPAITTFYIVEIITPEGCHIFDTVNVIVDQDLPYPNLIDAVTICKGSGIQIAAGGATSYLWSPNYNITSTTIYNPVVSPDVDTSYAVTFTNACGSTYDTVDVFVIEVIGTICPDTIICPEGEAVLWASGGVSYSWQPSGTLSDPNDSITNANPTTNTLYHVTITDIYGCSTTLYTQVAVFESPVITVSPAVYAIQGDTVGIWANGNGTIVWSPPYYMYCVECAENFVYPPNETFYTATLTDANGCIATGIVPVYFDPLIYVPNAFTPNADQWNNYFQAVTHNIESFDMMIFNRWGEIVYRTSSIDHQWDGTYNGVKVPDDVYVWVIDYRDLKGVEKQLRGHVAVLR